MKIGISPSLSHADYTRISDAIIAAGHTPVVLGGPYEQPPSHKDVCVMLQRAIDHDVRYIDENLFRRDTGIVRNPALPKKPINRGGSRYF